MAGENELVPVSFDDVVSLVMNDNDSEEALLELLESDFTCLAQEVMDEGPECALDHLMRRGYLLDDILDQLINWNN